MKRIYLILLSVLCTLTISAQTIGEAFYIYRNDGQINGFFRGEIDSIAYSFYDRDSLLHNDIVTQVVFTEDSVYRIPLEVIDSVGFVTPKTKCKSGVIDLSVNHMPYIMSCDSLTINFSDSTPSELFPKVGEKLMTLDMNEIFPAGFAGEVTAVSGDKVICKRVPLEDIFETYYNVTSAYGYVEDSEGEVKKKFIDPINKTWAKDFKFNTITIPITAELSRNVKPNSDLALKGGSSHSIEITPSFHVLATLIITHDETYFNASVTGEANIKNKVSIFGGIDWSHDFLDRYKIEEHISPYVNFIFNPGIFLRASATASLSAVLEQVFSFCWGGDWSSKGKNLLKPTNNPRLKSWDFDVEGCVDGSIGTGLYTEIGVSLLHSDIDKIVFRGELGGEFESHAMLYNFDIADANKNTRTYERFKQSSFDVNVFVQTSVQAQLADGLWEAGFPLPYNFSYQLKTWDIVPKFSNTTFLQSISSKTSAEALVDISGDCLIPVSIGLSVRDENGEEVDEHYDEEKFDNGAKNLPFTFSNLSPDVDYTLYPKVRIFDWDILASPAAKLEKVVCPVTLSDFTVTQSQYKKDGFTHDGQNYDYRFDVSVTATLDVEDLTKVADWGYVYRDPNGREAFISLFQFGTNYTDKRYAYFRNQAHSTCTLYGYVKYIDRDKYVFDESEDFPLDYVERDAAVKAGLCPDNHHPHIIDLGYNDYSGTGAEKHLLWSCCNLGAKSPEEYGNYYAWGETKDKSVYSWETYVHNYSGNDTPYSWDLRYLDNLSGTSYDAARANWGSSWHMFTKDDIMFLLNECEGSSMILNGVKGYKFTGQNGNSIFLPYAGYYNDNEILEAGVRGFYWRDEIHEGNWNAYCLSFNYGGSYSRYVRYDVTKSRKSGLPIRPITIIK